MIRGSRPSPASELDTLDMEVWLLWGLQPMTARGRDREHALTIGKHGLQIARGSARGLLLPGVAVDHHLDAKGFLQQVCLKAGLPTDAWLSDDTQLMTFEGYAIRGRLASVGLGQSTGSEARGPNPVQLAALAKFCRENLIALVQWSQRPASICPGDSDGGVHGVALTIGLPGTEQRIECNQLSLRPDMPLQSTLHQLTEAAAKVLRARHVQPGALQTSAWG